VLFTLTTGDQQIVVQSLETGGKWQISTEGGTAPVWARNGRELFYLNDDKMMA
jgi:Tol biopolymer transport system component